MQHSCGLQHKNMRNEADERRRLAAGGCWSMTRIRGKQTAQPIRKKQPRWAVTRMHGKQIPRAAYDGQQNFIRRSLRQADKFCIRAKPKHSFVEILARLKRWGRLSGGAMMGGVKFYFNYAQYVRKARSKTHFPIKRLAYPRNA